MPDDSWFYRDGDQDLGPVKSGEFASLVRNGLASAATPVRRDGGSEWSPLGEALPELFLAPSGQEGGWRDVSPHPWRRYFARTLDTQIVGGVTWALVSIVFYAVAPEQAERFFRVFSIPGGQFLDAFLTMVVSIPGNALMIGLTGLSIGKWLFGVRVLRDGAPIGFWRALRREIAVWFRGWGLGLPLVSLLCTLSSRAYLEDHRITTWDKAQKLTVTHRSESRWATAMMWTAGAGVVLIGIGLRLLAQS